MAINVLAATLVRIIHILFVLWVVITPFSNNEPMLVLHFIVMPFLWFHWSLSSDVCSLTMMEMYFRGVSHEESFMHSIVSPIYKIDDNQVRQVSWVISILLWLVTLSKILKNPSMIRNAFLLRIPEEKPQQ